ncbi:MAG: radical SAM protein [uncultured bacterium]|nr:MAG: radical SAM protein [uncultured bacterium]
MAKITFIELYDGVKASFGGNTYSRGNAAPPYALECLAGYMLEKARIENINVSVNVIQERAVTRVAAYASCGMRVTEKESEMIEIGNCEIVDMILEQASDAMIGERVIVGIRAVSMLFNDALELSNKIKKSVPNAIIVIGGYHTSELKEKSFKGNKFKGWQQELRDSLKNAEIQLVDFGVIGEGEETVWQLIKSLELRNDFSQISGLMFFDKNLGRWIFNGKRPRIGAGSAEKISLPSAYRMISVPIYDGENFIRSIKVPSSIDCTQYATFPAADKIRGEIQVGYCRSCPHECDFCPSVELWGKQVTQRRPEEVVAEIFSCHVDSQFLTNYVYFADLTFNHSIPRLMELLKEMQKCNAENMYQVFGGMNVKSVHWFALAEAFNFERHDVEQIKSLLHLMHDLGCAKLGIGVEGIMPEEMLSFKNFIGTPREHGDKEWTKDEEFAKAVQRACNVLMTLKLTNDAGIFTRGYFLLGMPGQNEQTVELMKALLTLEVPEEFFEQQEILKSFLRQLFKKFNEDRQLSCANDAQFTLKDTAKELKRKISLIINERFEIKDASRVSRLVGVDHIRIVPVAYYPGTKLAARQKLYCFECYRDEKTGKLFHDADGRPLPKLFSGESELELVLDEKRGFVYKFQGKNWTVNEIKTIKSQLKNRLTDDVEGQTLLEMIDKGFDDWDLLDYFKTPGSTFLNGTIVTFPFPEKEIVKYVYTSREYQNHMEGMVAKWPYLKEAVISWEDTLNKKGAQEAGLLDKSRLFRFADRMHCPG